MIRVLFVCLGNICRSPIAEGVFRDLVVREGLDSQIETDSCGTASYHVGSSPDSRAIERSYARHVDISDLRARQLQHEDFENFDYLLVMDRNNLRDVKTLAPSQFENKIELFLSYSNTHKDTEVPDPYYGDDSDFDVVLDMVEEASRNLLLKIKSSI